MTLEIIDSYSPVTVRDIDAVEREMELVLPDDYRAFLLRHNGGEFADTIHFPLIEPSYGGMDYGLFCSFYAINESEKWAGQDIRESMPSSDRDVGRMVRIANDYMGAIGIVCTGHDRGYVYLLSTTDDFQLFLAARSFTEFYNSLYKDDTDEDDTTKRSERLAHFMAVANGDYEEVAAYLKAGGEVDGRNEQGLTMLMAAACHRRPRIVELLLARGAEIATRDDVGESALAKAIAGHNHASGSVDCVKILLAHGANPDDRFRTSETALMAVLKYFGNMRIASLLIDAGSDVNARDDAGETPISCCAWRYFPDVDHVFHKLLARGAQPDPAIPLLAAAIRNGKPPGEIHYCAPSLRYKADAYAILEHLHAIDALLELFCSGDTDAGFSISEDDLSHPKCQATFCRMLAKGNEEQRAAAAALLGYIASPSKTVITSLTTALRDGSENVREAAQESLERIRGSELE